MRPESDAAAFLWDAITFARNVGIAVDGASLKAYLEGGPIAWATERQIELVGEALNNLRKVAPELAERVPDLRKIVATRNILVHGYTQVDSTIVWQAATQAVPALIPILESILSEVAPPAD